MELFSLPEMVFHVKKTTKLRWTFEFVDPFKNEILENWCSTNNGETTVYDYLIPNTSFDTLLSMVYMYGI